MTFIPVILSGGAGSRLWPRSRELAPKQLLSHDGADTLLQQTATRLAQLPEAAGPMVVCNVEHCAQIVTQLAEVHADPQLIIEEPVGRNTAPALAAAALAALELGGDPVLLAAPADHIITNEVAFKEAVMTALPHAEKGRLVTLGVVPDSPHTGFGYIKVGDELTADAFRVAEFVEKPDITRAEYYLASGEFLWNSGMLLARASAILDQLLIHAPDVANSVNTSLDRAGRQDNRITLDDEAFAGAPALSMEYAVLEHTSSAMVVPLRTGWNDLGSWSALWEVGAADDSGNVHSGDVVSVNSRNTLVHAESRLVATAGLDDIVVVETPDAVLVAHRDNAEEVKAVVAELRRDDRPETITHRKVVRPWGSYEVLDAGPRDQVKRLVVNPGARLSLQRHLHRAEHWVVTQGTALVQLGEEEITVAENGSVFVPTGVAHRITNHGFIPLQIIETQTGNYLGEDDITRLEDDFGRVG
jgi:mannose-1-phosphate guanylyltransferase/mannose-6-phosphate isomerase